MSFDFQVFEPGTFPARVAEHIADCVEGGGSLVLTGGTTAERIYPLLAKQEIAWGALEILFSDERCVPPTDPASNFGMAERLLFERAAPMNIHRMPGEEPPSHGADLYHHSIAPVIERGLDVVLLGMGADAHVGALYPGSLALDETDRYCAAVDRPDGMKGLTLTPPAMLAGKKILLLVTGEAKAETVKRVVEGNESVASCPARLLADHPDVTLLLDEPAASALDRRDN